MRIGLFILVIFLICLSFLLINQEISTEKANAEQEKKEKFFNNVRLKFETLKVKCDEGLIEELYATFNFNGLNVDLFLSQAFVESRFNKNAIGMAGERGIIQFMESTAKDIANKIGWTYIRGMEFNPYISLQMYEFHIKELMVKYNGNMQLALLGYNCGTGCVDYYLSNGYSAEQMKKCIYGNKKPYGDKVGEVYALLAQLS